MNGKSMKRSGAKMPGVGRGNNPASHVRKRITPGTKLKMERNDPDLSYSDKKRLSRDSEDKRRGLAENRVSTIERHINSMLPLMAHIPSGRPERRTPQQIAKGDIMRQRAAQLREKHGLW